MTQEKTYRKLFEECRMLILNQDYSKSLQKLNQLISEFPEQPDPFLLKANALVMLRGNEGHSKKDIEQFVHDQKKCIQKALEMYPEHVLALVDMADFCADAMILNEENKKLILNYFDTAISLLTHNKFWDSFEDEVEIVYWSKAQFLKKIGKETEAKKCLQEGLKLCPDSIWLDSNEN